MEQLSERRDRLVGTLVEQIGSQVTPASLTRAAVAVLRLDAATISVASPTGLYLAAAHGPLGTDIEMLQHRLGDGPTLTALEEDGPVVALDGAAGFRRWPVFGPEVAAKGVTALFSLPLRPRRDAPTALSLYATGTEQFDDRRVGDVLLIADLIAEAMIDPSLGDLPARLRQVGDDRTAVHHATGILAAREALSPARALSSIRSQAARAETTVTRMAAQIMSRDPSPGPSDR